MYRMWRFRIRSAIFLCVKNSGSIYCQEDETMASINMLLFDGSGIVPFTEKKLLFSFSTAADDVSLRLITYTRQNRRVVHLKIVLSKMHLTMLPNLNANRKAV